MMKDEEVVTVRDGSDEIVKALGLSDRILATSDKLMKHKAANDQLIIDDVALQLMTDAVQTTLELNNLIIQNQDVLKPNEAILNLCGKISQVSEGLVVNTKVMKEHTLEDTMQSWSDVHGLGLTLAIAIVSGVESDIKKAREAE